MRKIGSEREDERKRKRNILVISSFMLLVLLVGTVGYGFISNPNNSGGNVGTEIKEGEVLQVGNQWAVKIGSQTYYFSNSPEELKDIPIDITRNLNSYVGKNLYIVSKSDAIASQIRTLLSSYASRVQEACFGSCEENLPEKDCSDDLIIWKDSLENKVYQEENCIFIEGDTRAVDVFLYRMLGFN